MIYNTCYNSGLLGKPLYKIVGIIPELEIEFMWLLEHTLNLVKATRKHQEYVIIWTHTQLGKSDTKTSEIMWLLEHIHNLAKATQEHQKYGIIGTHTQFGKSDTKTSEYVIIGTHTQFGKRDTKASEIMWLLEHILNLAKATRKHQKFCDYWNTYVIAWKFRGMKVSRFRGRVQKTAKLKYREKCILSWTAKLKCREKSFNGQPRN